MHSANRASLREIFFTAERVPNVYFYTSNINKFLQARAVFAKCGILLKHYKSSTDPYSEDYTIGKRGLLRRALEEVSMTLGASSLFFVEDTSIRIDALSSQEADYPGLAAKEWFFETQFGDLDDQLTSIGDNRGASVRSDIALYIPALDRPVYFEGVMHGCIASKAPQFEQSPRHPWLTPTSFNGWIIPTGADKPLGQMSFEESWQYDFRVKALLKLIDRLEEYAAALNLSSQTYTRRSKASTDYQLELIPTEKRAFIIVGRTCAGKTTMGDRLASEHGFRFIEASSVLRTFRTTEDDTSLEPLEFAKLVLQRRGADIVARKVLALLGSAPPDRVAITGFRTIEELECVLEAMPYAQVVFVEASERTRFERHVKRARVGETTTIKQFSEADVVQWQFGLLRVAEDFADLRILNEGSIQEFLTTVDGLAMHNDTSKLRYVTGEVHPRHGIEQNQLYKCLDVLQAAGRPLDCGEIESMTARWGSTIRHNNANKVLKQVPELAKRFEMRGSRIRYQVTDAGRAYVRLMKNRSTTASEPEQELSPE